MCVLCVRACVHAHNDRNEFNTLVVQRNLVKFPAGPKSDRQYAERKQELIAYRLRSIVRKGFSSEMEKAIIFPARVFRGMSWQISQIFHLVEKHISCETHENIFENEKNSIQ